MRRACAPVALALILAGCGGDSGGGSVSAPSPGPSPSPSPSPSPTPTSAVQATTIATLASPWAMTFLPDGRLLVTEKGGALRIVSDTGTVSAPVTGLPPVATGGQGGLLDIALHPSHATNGLIYWSYSEGASDGTKGLAIARGRLTLSGGAGALDQVQVIWRQSPKVGGDGHFGGRIVFAPDGRLFATAGERQRGTPAQDRGQTLGKIIRLNADGTIPSDNPFVGTAGTLPEIWSLGHRNPYGLIVDGTGQLWAHEHGPQGGDELNRIDRGANYGWPNVSNGDDYGGAPIPDHAPGDGFAPPAISWNPAIAPAGMVRYRGTRFVGWQGDFILGGLVSQGLVRVRVDATGRGTEVQRIALGNRIREVREAPDGALWVLEDGATGRLRRLLPAP